MGEWNESVRKHPRGVKHSHLRVTMITLTHSGGQGGHQSYSVMKRREGTQPFSVLIPSTSTPFTPAVDRERLDLAIRCQTCSASGSGPDGRDMPDTNMHCDKRYTQQYGILLYYYHKGTHRKRAPISKHPDMQTMVYSKLSHTEPPATVI